MRLRKRLATRTPSLISPPEGMTLGNELAVSPDGQRILFQTANATGRSQLWVRNIDSPQSEPLAGTEGATEASVSRDGTFRIDDVPDGDYTLTVRFSRDAAGKLPSRRFSVPKDGTNQDCEAHIKPRFSMMNDIPMAEIKGARRGALRSRR